MESYKNKSRIITIISFIITCASYITVDQLLPLLPTSLKVFAPTIIAILGYAAAQLSEEKRVGVAESLAIQESNVGESDDECI